MLIAKMAISIPGPDSIIEEPSHDAACHCACYNEPPAADNLLDEERYRTRHHPGDAASCTAPKRNEHGGKKDRHYQIDAEHARIGHEYTQPIAGADRDNPHHSKNCTAANEDAGIRSALRAIPH